MATPYTTLKVEHAATTSELRQAYRRASLTHHPDKGGDPSKFRIAQAAYELPNDPIIRSSWDLKKGFRRDSAYDMWRRTCISEGVKFLPHRTYYSNEYPRTVIGNADAEWADEKRRVKEQRQREATHTHRKTTSTAKGASAREKTCKKTYTSPPTASDPLGRGGRQAYKEHQLDGDPVFDVPDDHPFAKKNMSSESNGGPKTARQNPNAEQRMDARKRKTAKASK